MHIVSVVGNKGGIGKTTITMNLGGCLIERGYRTLLIDLNHQANLTEVFIETVNRSIIDLFAGVAGIRELIYNTSYDSLQILPANSRLAGLDKVMAEDYDAQFRLAEYLKEVSPDYDWVLIDCPNSFGLATRLALVAATHYLVPVECHQWSVQSTGQTIAHANNTKRIANPPLQLLGLVINKLDVRRGFESRFRIALREAYGFELFNTEFRDCAAYAEAAFDRKPITVYKSNSREANEYRALLAEIEQRIGRIHTVGAAGATLL